MLGLCLVEVSPHPQGMPLRLFSVSSGFAAGREEELGDRLGRILRDIRIPETYWLRSRSRRSPIKAERKPIGRTARKSELVCAGSYQKTRSHGFGGAEVFPIARAR